MFRYAIICKNGQVTVTYWVEADSMTEALGTFLEQGRDWSDILTITKNGKAAREEVRGKALFLGD